MTPRAAVIVGACVAAATAGALIACGSFGEAPATADTSDGASADGPDSDGAQGDGGTNVECRRGEFGDPSPISIGPSPGLLGLTAVRPSSLDRHVYYSRGETLGTVDLVDQKVTNESRVSMLGPGEGPTLTADGLYLFFHRDVPPRRLFRGQRMGTEGNFTMASEVGNILGAAPASEVQDAYVAGDHVYFAYQPDNDDQGRRLYLGDLVYTPNGPTITNGRVVPGFEDAPGPDDHPVVSADGLEIFFATDRGGARGIWHARRSAATAPFEAPAFVTLKGADGDEKPTWISDDNCELYFIRGSGSEQTAAKTTRK